MGTIWERVSLFFQEDNRKATRQKTTRLVAYYWDGATPQPHPIRDISETGAYLMTEQRWRPGTIVTMTLQRDTGTEQDVLRSIAVQAKVVRQGPDGVGLRFVLSTTPRSKDDALSAGRTADRRTLLDFIEVVDAG